MRTGRFSRVFDPAGLLTEESDVVLHGDQEYESGRRYIYDADGELLELEYF